MLTEAGIAVVFFLCVTLYAYFLPDYRKKDDENE